MNTYAAFGNIILADVCQLSFPRKMTRFERHIIANDVIQSINHSSLILTMLKNRGLS